MREKVNDSAETEEYLHAPSPPAASKTGPYHDHVILRVNLL